MIWWNLAPWIIGAMLIIGMSLVVYATWQMLGKRVVEDDHD